jgi:hypothetical protein
MKLSPEQIVEIAAVKRITFDAAVAAGVPKQSTGIIVDEQFGVRGMR